MINPYNQHIYEVSLRPQDVQGFVFWSRNYQFFLKDQVLEKLSQPFLCHMTITGYPRHVDQATIATDKAVKQMQDLSRRMGRKCLIWRYDPIVISAEMDKAWHMQNFTWIAQGLVGCVDEVVVSFLHSYEKTKRNFKQAGFVHCDPTDGEKQDLLHNLFEIAQKYGIKLTICGQPDLSNSTIQASICIDAQRLSEIAGRDLSVQKTSHRKECACDSSKDIGDYNTCPHGCLYCYAVVKRSLAKQRYQHHDPESPFLFEPERGIEKKNPQMSFL